MTASVTRETESADGRSASRRRGNVLSQAILQATLAELAEVGYAAMTMESVALRAQASKASLYRRWPNRTELVVDAMECVRPYELAPPDTGNVRDDLLILLRRMISVHNSPAGEATHGLLAEVLRHPELLAAVRERFITPAIGLVLEVLRAGAARGEVRRSALTERIASVGPALLRDHFLIHGAPVPDSVPLDIVDDIVLPIISPTRPGRRTRAEP
ncbi:MAG TPA: TetR/AcrR family transcriptional regulator [Pseudonocardia sp.]|nr:TetR/AcrR family transcriptional regulator [Pseudonocardia sp.]